MQIKNKLEISREGNPSTILLTLYSYYYNSNGAPLWTFEELEGWRGFTLRERVNEKDPNGGSYVDKYSTPQSKVISLIMNVIITDPSDEHDVELKLDELVENDDLLRLKLTTEYPDKTVSQSLKNCFFTDVSPAERNGRIIRYAFTLTSTEFKLTAPVVT